MGCLKKFNLYRCNICHRIVSRMPGNEITILVYMEYRPLCIYTRIYSYIHIYFGGGGGGGIRERRDSLLLTVNELIDILFRKLNLRKWRKIIFPSCEKYIALRSVLLRNYFFISSAMSSMYTAQFLLLPNPLRNVYRLRSFAEQTSCDIGLIVSFSAYPL